MTGIVPSKAELLATPIERGYFIEEDLYREDFSWDWLPAMAKGQVETWVLRPLMQMDFSFGAPQVRQWIDSPLRQRRALTF